jgi:HEXXH motif-containing protein
VVWPYGTHQLSETDIAALAIGDFQDEIIQVLRAAELSKHVLLLEAIRREIGRRPSCEGARSVGMATRLLDEVQARAPEVVAEILRSPHFGLWAARCLFHLRDGAGLESGDAWQREIRHLAIFAAVPALRIGYPFDLTVPAQRGRVAFPTLGAAIVGQPASSGLAQIRLDRQGARITSAARSVRLPAGVTRSRDNDPHWQPTVELEAEADGIRLTVTLETADPLLRLLGPAAVTHPLAMRSSWQQGLQEAWQILVQQDRKAASGLASVLTTLVPLADPPDGDVISATSGWAWGAIAMNLPADAALVAETLDHEFHHLVLASVEDLLPLVGEDDHGLYYAAWREDPRPASALVQGIYAHLGVAKFWRQRRWAESPPNQLRSEVKFIHSCRTALEAGRALVGTNNLTVTGRALIAGMLEQFGAWQYEPVSRVANSIEVKKRLEHQLRWRLTHCRPSSDTTDALAHAWLGERKRGFAGPLPPPNVVPYDCRLSSDLAMLLDMRYLNPHRLEQLTTVDGSLEPWDHALLTGDYEKASDEYLQLITERKDRAGWVGLLLARYCLTGDMDAIAQHPEVVVGVYEKILALTGSPPGATSLIEWLNKLPTSAA